jgi:PAT family beta-lactamase induction signal transducer AmpG
MADEHLRLCFGARFKMSTIVRWHRTFVSWQKTPSGRTCRDPVLHHGMAMMTDVQSRGWVPPVWLLGLCNLPLGITGAVMLMTAPQLLAANGVPEPQIASITAIALLPGFCSFLVAPLLDWRFSRRSYAILLAVVAATMQFVALMFIRNLEALTLFLFAGFFAVQLNVAAIGGWFATITRVEDKGALGAWLNVGNGVGFGVTSIVAIFLLRDLPYAVGAAILSLLVLLPVPVLIAMQGVPADDKLASESFRAFFRDILALLRNRAVLWALLLFAMPAASFALTNTLGGIGHEFHASERLVGVIGGVGVTLAGVAGALMIAPALRRSSPLTIYLLVGGTGALFTLLLIALPLTPAVFALAIIGENLFQSAAFTVQNTIILRTIGEDNPLAATQFAILVAAVSLPISYMQAIDGQAYGYGGVAGSFLADGVLTMAACALLALALGFARKRGLTA